MRSIAPGLAAIALFSSAALAQPTTVNYAMTVAGLPIGSATMVLTPNGSSTTVALSGRVGGPFDLGRLNASAVVAQGQVTAQSQSGSGKDTATANLTSRGRPGDSAFAYAGQTNRGPGKIAMTVAGGRAAAIEASIPDNPKAVRVPVTEAHKTGIVDPLSLLAEVIAPGGTMRPESLCGRNYGVFTGQTRFNLSGLGLQPANARGLPEGWTALACRVTFAPVAGHRIDKGASGGQPRTASLIFARSPDGTRTVLWSLTAQAPVGSFALTANGVK